MQHGANISEYQRWEPPWKRIWCKTKENTTTILFCLIAISKIYTNDSKIDKLRNLSHFKTKITLYNNMPKVRVAKSLYIDKWWSALIETEPSMKVCWVWVWPIEVELHEIEIRQNLQTKHATERELSMKIASNPMHFSDA